LLFALFIIYIICYLNYLSLFIIRFIHYFYHSLSALFSYCILIITKKLLLLENLKIIKF